KTYIVMTARVLTLSRSNHLITRVSLLSLLACSAALSQDLASSNAPATMKPTLVTGSSIPTFETITPQPVDVYSIEDIHKTGVNSVSQLIQRLPAVSGNASFGDSRGNGGDGSSQIGLRNIANGTLVLINGRRVAPNQLGSGDPG